MTRGGRIRPGQRPRGAARGAAGVPFQLGAGHMSARLAWTGSAGRPSSGPAIQVILPDWVPTQPDEVHPRPWPAWPPWPGTSRSSCTTRRTPRPSWTRPPCSAACGRGAPAHRDQGGRRVTPPGTRPCALRRRPGRLRRRSHAGHGLAQGAGGAYSNVACLSPAGAVAWYQTMRADPAAAAATERGSRRFLAEHISPLQQRGYNNAALDKTLAHIGGWAPRRHPAPLALPERPRSRGDGPAARGPRCRPRTDPGHLSPAANRQRGGRP